MKVNRKIIAALSAVFASLALAATASAATLKGTVVHTDRDAHSFVVAAHNGHLSEVHSSRIPSLGSRVSVNARLLHNRTYAARSIHRSGFSRHVRIHGVVTYVDHANNSFVVSGTRRLDGRTRGECPPDA